VRWPADGDRHEGLVDVGAGEFKQPDRAINVGAAPHKYSSPAPTADR
jgi:hypothetical protein